MKKAVKRIMAILIMVILLFSIGCVQGQPLPGELFTNVDDFIYAMKTKYKYDKTRDYYAFGESFMVGGDEYKLLLIASLWSDGKKYRRHIFSYVFIDEEQNEYSRIYVEGVYPKDYEPEFFDDDIVKEIETEKGEAILVYNTRRKGYKLQYRDTEYIIIKMNHSKYMLDEESFIDLSMRIIESKWIIEELK